MNKLIGVSYISSILHEAEYGAIGGFIGQFLGDAIEKNIIRKSNERTIDITSSGYISAIIAVFFAGIVLTKTSFFNGVVFAVGLNKVTFDTIDRMYGNEGLEHKTIIRDFIFDAIAIYYLILILKEIVDIGESEDAKFLSGILVSLVVNVYYSIKRLQSNTT